MPKNKDFAQELKEEFAQGNLKPSQLKKSRSAEDILPDERLSDLKKEITVQEHTNMLLNQECLGLRKSNDELAKQIKQLEQEKIMLTDQNLELRLKALKSADQIGESEEGLSEAVERLVKIEQKQINYQVQNKILLREKGDLQKQLGLAQERIQSLYRLKGLPSSENVGETK